MARILKIFLVLFLLVFLILPGIVTYVLLNPPREKVDQLLELSYEEVTFPSRDALKLHGWHFPGEKGQIIMAHGYSRNRMQNDVPGSEIIQALIQDGYGVLTFDFRNSGQSQSGTTTVGYEETKDLLGALDYLKAQKPHAQIVIMGFSMGAATALLTAAAYEGDIQGLILDSPFANLSEYLTDNLHKWSRLPAWPFTPIILLMARAMGLPIEQVQPVQAMGEIHMPVFLIHGLDDGLIHPSNSQRIKAIRPDNTQLWLVPQAGHVQSYSKDPSTYLEKLWEFLDRSFAGS